MTTRLQDVWLPEVEAEYLALLSMSRDVGVEVGDQFRAFEQILMVGVDDGWRALDYVGAASVYALFGRCATMFFALTETQAAVVKWAAVGTEYAQRLAREQAEERTRQVFP